MSLYDEIERKLNLEKSGYTNSELAECIRDLSNQVAYLEQEIRKLKSPFIKHKGRLGGLDFFKHEICAHAIKSNKKVQSPNTPKTSGGTNEKSKRSKDIK